MTKCDFLKPNLLGDLRAEADGEMLGQVFLETGDYRSLIETSDRIIVVGRRGTGKSALTLRLEAYWSKNEKTEVTRIAPEEYQVIGIRPLVNLFGDRFNLIRAGSRLVWRYALMLEAAQHLSSHYKFSKLCEQTVLAGHIHDWRNLHKDTTEKVRITLRSLVNKESNPEERIADLPIKLDLAEIESVLLDVTSELDINVVLLIDRLDEGYEPDEIGIGFVDGLIQAAIDIKTRFSNIKPIIFMRDNIFRSVQKNDQDYSRNIEGHVLRLHWDEANLFSFAALRLRIAFHIEHEASLKIWNKCVVGELKGKSGFQKCLRFTLFRPRDLLALFNEAFFIANKDGREELTLDDLEITARIISQNRLEDLKKEYVAVLPGLHNYIGVFHGKDPQQSVDVTRDLIHEMLTSGSNDPVVQQDFLILEDANSVIRGLYSVGFLGIREPTSGNFIFCHDGRAPDREFAVGDQILVHPCYWIALNCTKNDLDPAHADEIYDEYDIEVSSETPAIRNNKIKILIAELENIRKGQDGVVEFEEWCRRVIRICFAKGLRNVELIPNVLLKPNRDVVATNLGDGDIWKRIYDVYSTKQVVFRINNNEVIEVEDYQHVQSSLNGGNGKLAFIVTRDNSVDLYANKDIEWVRDIYRKDNTVVIKLTAKYLCKLLHKLRNPQKHDGVNNAMHAILDTYVNLYFDDSKENSKKRKRRRKVKTSRNEGNKKINEVS